MTPTVVFDLDKVLVGGDAVTLFLRGVFRRAPTRALLLSCAAPLLSLAALLGPLRPLCARVLIRLVIVGRSAGEDEVADIYRAALALSPQAAVVDAVACLRAHRAAGERVVVATAAEETLARGFLTALGLHDVEVVGSTGALCPPRAQRAHGQTKVRLLIQRGYPPPWATVYSDSASDSPLLAGSTQPVLVNPTNRALRRVTQALGRPPETRTWR